MTRWLSLIGIGEDGRLAPIAQSIVENAALIVGGARHLGLIGETRAEKLQWPSPLEDALETIAARRGAPVVVLASGDPFFYGVGDLLARQFAPEEMLCIPASSAFSLAASRLLWSQQNCALVSLHGRAFERLAPHLQPSAKLLVLCWDETTPARIAAYLVARGFGQSRLHVLECLGGPRERIRATRACDFALEGVAALNMVAIEVVAEADARVIPLTPGLPDDWFENDGQLTKREVRAVTLSALAPRKGEVLWDVGAGSGSISIEWMLTDPANRAVAIEAKPERAARIARNAAALGVPDLRIVTGRAPEALAALPAPDAIFIGGGAEAQTLQTAWEALPYGGRIVVNAVTLETQATLHAAFQERGGDLTHVQIARARPVGRFHGLDPAMAVLQWRAVKR